MAYVGQQLLPIDDAFPMEMSTGEEWRGDPGQQPCLRLLAPEDVEAWETEEEEDPITTLRVTRRART